MRYITAFFMAWGNFFYVPCPVKLWDNNLRRLQLVFFPFIGFLIGLLWYALLVVCEYFKLPIALAAFILAIYPYKISGFIHLDGFMDCSDAILSRRNLEERIRILKDSHVGAFAVINIAILFLASYASTNGILDISLHMSKNQKMIFMAPLLFIPVLSRACSAFAVMAFRPMDTSQYLTSYDIKTNKKYLAFVGMLMLVSLAIAYILFGWRITILLELVILVHFGFTFQGRLQLGGMNGDIAGYALTISECAGLLLMNIL